MLDANADLARQVAAKSQNVISLDDLGELAGRMLNEPCRSPDWQSGVIALMREARRLANAEV